MSEHVCRSLLISHVRVHVPVRDPSCTSLFILRPPFRLPAFLGGMQTKTADRAGSGPDNYQRSSGMQACSGIDRITFRTEGDICCLFLTVHVRHRGLYQQRIIWLTYKLNTCTSSVASVSLFVCASWR